MFLKNTLIPTMLRGAFNKAAPPYELSARIPNYGLVALSLGVLAVSALIPVLGIPAMLIPVQKDYRESVQIAFNVVAQDIRSIGKLMGMERHPSEEAPVKASTKPFDVGDFLKEDQKTPLRRLKNSSNSM